ncbi:hypothetical protein DOY81_015636, partial [Sarcophaga bullata]
ECVPSCVDCKHGKCIRPNVCHCPHGYQNYKNRTICEPLCLNTCVNGKCSAPEECTCNEGYAFVNGSRTVCQATCKDVDCTNGHCDEKNKCTCNFGYVLDDSLKRCVAFCEEPCE